MADVVVFGGSGYSGLELLRLLCQHPHAKVVGVSSDRNKGQAVREHVLGLDTDCRFETPGRLRARVKAEQVCFLCTPAETSLELAPKLLDAGAKVVDLSGAFRLGDIGLYPEWYGFEHDQPALLEEAVYGLVELFIRESTDPPRLVANPGCYPTAAILALAPLVGGGLLDRDGCIYVDGKSGTTGAGRKLDESLLFSEVADTIRPYRLHRHQHTPEMERALTRLARVPVQLAFTPHLIPTRRGLVISAYAKAAEGLSQEAIDAAFEAAYGKAPFVRYLKERPPEPQRVLHTNFCEVSARLDERTGSVFAFGAIDNLVKGAAGQAIQNFNLILGLDSATGLLPIEEPHD